MDDIDMGNQEISKIEQDTHDEYTFYLRRKEATNRFKKSKRDEIINKVEVGQEWWVKTWDGPHLHELFIIKLSKVTIKLGFNDKDRGDSYRYEEIELFERADVHEEEEEDCQHSS